MHILVIGLNHRTAPVPVREKVAISKARTSEAFLSLQGYVDGGVILSTCNRTEIYAQSEQPSAEAEKIKSFLGDYSGLPLSELESHLYAFNHKEAVKHLFKVASGLDSMIVGEYEVLGQVGYALEQAEATHRPLPMLNLFRRAVAVGRRVRQETEISRNPVSVSAATVGLCRQVFPDISGCKVLVIGAGEAGRLAVEALVKNGVSHIAVTSRSYSHAQELASSLGGQAIAFHHMVQVLKETDIVISCSGSPHFVLEPPAIAEAMQARPHHPLLLIDIAVPRDIAPEVRDVAGVFLHDIDELIKIGNLNHHHRQAETQKVMAIIEEEVTKFMDWWSSLAVRPTIAALVNRAEAVRQAQLAKTLSKMENLSQDDRIRLEAMTKAIVKNILHKPIMHLKNNGKSAELLQVTQELFDLDPEGDSSNK